MDDRGEVVAIDANSRGVERIARMAQRLGLSIVHPQVANVATRQDVPLASTPQASTFHGSRFTVNPSFDCVLVDAPCSGLGTLRQHPEVRWRRTPADIAALAGLQRKLLRAVAPSVRSGGVLVYSTCTLSITENEEVIATFRDEHPDFAIEDPKPFLAASAHALIGDDGALRTFPHHHGLDGFFAVRLKRRGGPGAWVP